MLKMLPVIGLIAPPILYLAFFGVNSSAFSALGLSGDNMIMGVAICAVVVWSWSFVEARSANKFFVKKDNPNFKMAFGINSISNTAALFTWLFINSMYNTQNISVAAAISLLLMFFTGNIVRLLLTKLVFNTDLKTSTNANKFILIFEAIIYLPAAYFFLTLGGVI